MFGSSFPLSLVVLFKVGAVKERGKNLQSTNVDNNLSSKAFMVLHLVVHKKSYGNSCGTNEKVQMLHTFSPPHTWLMLHEVGVIVRLGK